MSHWANDYVGLPWSAMGYGPGEFNCWGLYWFVSKKYYNREVPKFQISGHEPAQYMREISREVATNWTLLKAPVDGCAVAMSQHKRIHHVGIFLAVDGGRILHSAEGVGVVCQKIGAVRLTYPLILFYGQL